MPADLILSNDGIQCASGAIVDVKVAMPVSGTYTAGSIVLELTTSNRLSGWKRLTTGSGHVLNTDWAYFNMPASPQSMVRLSGPNGYGSTNTKIRRLLTTVVNQGSDITYADSATLGALFTINTSGAYAISYADQFGGGAWMGVSLNAASLTASITSASATEILAATATSAANSGSTTTFTGYLAAGSLIRPHTDGTAVGGAFSGATIFTITRVA